MAGEPSIRRVRTRSKRGPPGVSASPQKSFDDFAPTTQPHTKTLRKCYDLGLHQANSTIQHNEPQSFGSFKWTQNSKLKQTPWLSRLSPPSTPLKRSEVRSFAPRRTKTSTAQDLQQLSDLTRPATFQGQGGGLGGSGLQFRAAVGAGARGLILAVALLHTVIHVFTCL